MMGRVIFLAFVLVAFSSPACGMTLQPDKSGDFKKTVEEIAAIAREAASEAIEEGLEEFAKGVIREGLEPSVGVGTAMSVIKSLVQSAFRKYHQRQFLKQVRKVDSKSAARDIWLDVAFILTEDPNFNPLNEAYCKKYSTAGASSLYNACILNRVTVGRVMSACGAQKKSKCTREEIISRYTSGNFCSDCNCCQNEDSKVDYFEKIQELYADTVKVILSQAIPDSDKTQTVRVQLYLEYAIRRPPITKDIFKEETNKLKLAREQFGITDDYNRRRAFGSKLTEIMNADVTEQLKKRLDRK